MNNKRLINKTKTLLFHFSFVFNTTMNEKKKRAFKRGLVTSHFVGYLFSFFLPRRGCRKEKKTCAFNTGLAQSQNIT